MTTLMTMTTMTGGTMAAAPSPRERVVRFGAGQGLAGILSAPRDARPDVPHVVFVNAGVVHRVGPNRLYVDVARALSALGYPVLRFDLAGLGDSEAGGGGMSLTEAAVADVQAAFDFLSRTRKATSFVLFGLCSGANYSLLTAFADPRVVGAMLIDPSTTRTRRGEMIHLSRRLLHAATWGSLLTLRHPAFRRSLGRMRTVSVLRNVSVLQVAERESVERAREVQAPSREAVRASLQQLVDRGTQLMMVFTGGVNHVYNYREQLFDLFPGFDFRGQLRLEYMPYTDHTVSDVASRTELIEAVREWMTRCFPGGETDEREEMTL
jgi:dienelactone hydrolase